MIRCRGGFALIYLLLLSAVIAIVLVALLSVSQSQIHQSRHARDRAQALLTAESGLAVVIAELERDSGWSAGFDGKALPGGWGSYSAVFSGPTTSSGTVCINNLMGDVAVDSYHGPGTVPPRSALLVVTGKAGISERTIEALVVSGSSLPEAVAVAASGRIDLRGNAEVTGVTSLLDPTPMPVLVHSNDEEQGEMVAYAPNGLGDILVVDGRVTSSSQSPASVSINLASPATVDSTQSGVAPKILPDINIEAMIADHSDSPGPPIPSGGTSMTFVGNNYYPGDLVIDGDVTLEDNARLFVRGDLRINGSIKGNGALVVQGNTDLHGSADVIAGADDYVSILGRGHVVLSGFEGAAFMDSLVATDPLAAEHWEDTQWAVREIQEYLDQHSHLNPYELSKQFVADDAYLDPVMTVIANHYPEAPDGVGRSRHLNTSGYFMSRFEGGAPGSTEAFLHSRFQQLDDIFRVCHDDRSGETARRHSTELVDSFDQYDPALDGGLFDSIQSWGEVTTSARAEVLREIVQVVRRFDYDRLGSAEFKGYVYTSGSLVVKNDLKILGAVVVNGRESLGPTIVDGRTYAPGELAFLDDSRLTYVDEMVRGGFENLLGAGKLDVRRWVAR